MIDNLKTLYHLLIPGAICAIYMYGINCMDDHLCASCYTIANMSLPGNGKMVVS
jgi:hypothetical protein